MECNKEEAIRAKEIAEKKMQNKDFLGARKIALKAQQLYPDLDNISHVLSVCDVHCSAEHRVFGNEMDWYSILQIEQTADEASIKKQYRKFALLLHPDKNKFPGAEAAFKLIGEAQRVLLDQGRRSLYDMKRKSSLRPAAPSQPTQRPNKNSNAVNYASRQFTGLNPEHQQRQQQTQPAAFPNGRQTFWTICPFCAVKYQYYREVVNRSLRCQSCLKPFVAYDMNTQGAPQGMSCGQPACAQQKEVHNRGSSKVAPRSTFDGPTSNGGFRGNFACENSTTESFPKTGCTSEVGMGSKTDEKCGNVDMEVGKGGFDASRKVNGKRRRKQVSESSDSCDTRGSTDSKDVIQENNDITAGQTFGHFEDRYPRRSSRNKQNVYYNENLSDNDSSVSSRKRAKRSGLSRATKEGSEDATLKEAAAKMNETADLAANVEEDEKEAKQKENDSFEESLPNGNMDTEENGKEKAMEDGIKSCSEAVNDSASNVSPRGTTDPEFYMYSDPDFSNFEKSREEGCFAVGQIWACYDTLDAMPRFYARIRKVFSPGFKLRITWLEPDPDEEDEIAWVSEDLPVSCGKFMHGNTENTEDRLMFSHLVSWEKGSGRDSYKIYPRMGETWALFKNWDIKWKSDANVKRKFEFEFVEVLSESVEDVGVRVARLGKVKGFACLFCRTIKGGVDSFLVPSNELFRFSYRVPSFKMTGVEREDVPRGSFELDPASLPTNLEEIAVPENFEVEARNVHANGSGSNPQADEVKTMRESGASAPMCQVEREAPLNPKDRSSDNVTENHSNARVSAPEAYEIPEPEFYDFDAEKTLQRFQIGQIWALYSDEDGLPKYYGQIKKIDPHPNFQLHLVWLEACSLPKNMIRWHAKDMPICCGRFKLKKGKPQSYADTGPFSHQLRAESTGKKNEYAILPRKGEVWALYKHWNAEMTSSDLEKCEYDIVEVLEEKDLWRKVSVLERVGGFNAVFKAQVRGDSLVMMEIPGVELLRFSHQIPAFQLTKERGGSLKGFWELDPASLPVLLFCSN